MEESNGPGVVLIVDDAETSAAALEVACAAIPEVEVWRLRSAVDALRILARDGPPVLAVITDLRMPRVDGFALIRAIRGNPERAGTPIIVVSAETDPASPERARALGADAYFSKPCSPVLVRETLERLLYDKRCA
jgi:two-component system chemotaxis response regulator CheY